MLLGKVAGEWTVEVVVGDVHVVVEVDARLVFGGYVAYDPVPDDVETLTFHDSSQPTLHRIKRAE